MKKNLFLRLCLMMAVVLSTFSCRQDLLPEKETYHNTSAFQLTSKRISLDEAKHKGKLLPELQKAEKAVEKQKLNIQGKLVNVGNGITIDTDQVIYTENGPNFHTYTFSVIRDNASANAPVENLLMTPQADGSYKVLHIALNLTEADKAKIANREYVDYKNKQQVTELASINLSSLSQKQMCVPQYYSYPVACAEGLHEPGQACAYAGTSGAAYWGGIVLYNCFGEPEYPTIMPIEFPEGGGGGGGEPCTDCPPETNTPQPCVQVPTDPTQPSSGMVDGNGCAIGLPNLPNIPDDADERTPCEVLKENSETPYIQTKLDSLKGLVSLDSINRKHHETGITINKRGQILKHKVFTKPKETGIAGAVAVEIQVQTWDILAAHNHYEGTFPAPQFGDIVTFYVGYKIAAPARKNAYTNYVVNFNGIEYAFRMSDTTALDALLAGLNQGTVADPTTEQEKKANDLIYKIFITNGFDKEKDYTEVEALKILMNVLNDSRIGNGVHLYKKDSITKRWAKLKLNLDGTVGQDDCPL